MSLATITAAPTCPPSCLTNHEAAADTETVTGQRIHTHIVTRTPAYIEVCRVDTLNGQTGDAEIRIVVDEDITTAQARQLAKYVALAADLADLDTAYASEER